VLQVERSRLGQVFERGKQVKKSLTAHIAALERELKKTDTELGQQVRRSPAWRGKDELPPTLPDVGRVLSIMLLAELPKPGRLRRLEVTRLVGVAPLSRDSGTFMPVGPCTAVGRGYAPCSPWARSSPPSTTSSSGPSINACWSLGTRRSWRWSRAYGSSWPFSLPWSARGGPGVLPSPRMRRFRSDFRDGCYRLRISCKARPRRASSGGAFRPRFAGFMRRFDSAQGGTGVQGGVNPGALGSCRDFRANAVTIAPPRSSLRWPAPTHQTE
jgi:hypothetical protein